MSNAPNAPIAIDLIANGHQILGITPRTSTEIAFERAESVIGAALNEGRISEVNHGNVIETRYKINTAHPRPDDQPTTITIKSGVMGGGEADRLAWEQQRAKDQHQILLNLPANYGEKEAKELAEVTAELEEISGYDRNGVPQYVLQGEARKRAEVRHHRMSVNVSMASATKVLSERVKADHLTQQAQDDADITARAEARAAEMIREEEVERLARQIVARTKVRNAPMGGEA